MTDTDRCPDCEWIDIDPDLAILGRACRLHAEVHAICMDLHGIIAELEERSGMKADYKSVFGYDWRENEAAFFASNCPDCGEPATTLHFCRGVHRVGGDIEQGAGS